ncbi:helix-turn-helix domain-containing protein [Clostridium perfringens]
MNKKKLGKNIKSIRQQKSLSREDICKKVNISIHTLAKYEQGQREPNIETLNKIADALEVPYDLLFLENHKQAMKNLAKKWNTMSEEERKEILDTQRKIWENEKIKSIQDAILTIAESADCVDFFLNEDITMNHEKAKRMFDIFVNTMKLLIDNADKK